MTSPTIPQPADTSAATSAATDPPAAAVHDGRARRIPFLLMIGAELAHEADGVAIVTIDLRPDLLNNHGGGHGGVVMSLLDSAMANAALSKVNYEREVVTIDMHVANLRAKLRDDPADPRVILTVRGKGYALAKPGTLESRL